MKPVHSLKFVRATPFLRFFLPAGLWRRFVLGVLFTMLLPVSSAFAVDIIANSKVNQQELSQATIRAIFGMRRNIWSDGSTVSVFVLMDDSPAHQAVCKEKLNLYPYQLRQLWERNQFTGIGQMPIMVANEEEMASRVEATPGAIGYVMKAPSNAKLKVIQIH